MTAVAPAPAADVWAQLAPPKPSADSLVKRDGHGRYQFVNPTTGEVQVFTRTTTIAETLSDRRGLEGWGERNIVFGLGKRPDLVELATSCTPDDKDQLRSIAEQAKEAAASASGANRGTARHRLTERIDAGERVVIGEPGLRADVDAYAQSMAAAGIRVARDPDTREPWIERVVLLRGLDVHPGSKVAGVAGMIDRLCLPDERWPVTPLTPEPSSLPRVSDLKTGLNAIKYGMKSIPLQLAIYAHAEAWVDLATGTWHPMPVVDRERAVVMHQPVGTGTCTLYEVDIAAGWEAVQLAIAVRRWRERKDLAHIISVPAPVGTPKAPEPTAIHTAAPDAAVAVQGPGAAAGEVTHAPAVPAGAGDASPAPAAAVPEADPAVLAATVAWVRGEAAKAMPPFDTTADAGAADEADLTWLRQRVLALIEAGHELLVAGAWPEGCPTLRQGGLARHHVEALIATLDAVEGHVGVPFGTERPAVSTAVARMRSSMMTTDEIKAYGAASSPGGVPHAEARRLAEAGKALLAQLGDEDEARAAAELALVGNDRMTPAGLDRLEAVVSQLVADDGAIWFAYGATGCHIEPSDMAEAAMCAAANGQVGRGKSAALANARRVIAALAEEGHQIERPRSLTAAAKDPLVAALVAAGRGAATPTTTTSNDGNEA